MVVRRCSNGSTCGRVVVPIWCKPSSCASLLRRSPNGSAAPFLRIATPKLPFPMLAIDRYLDGRREDGLRNLSCLEYRTVWMLTPTAFASCPTVRPAVTFSHPMRLQTLHEGTGHSGEFFFPTLPNCKNSLDQATPLRQLNYEKAWSVVTVSRLTEVLCPSLYAPMETSTDLQKRD